MSPMSPRPVQVQRFEDSTFWRPRPSRWHHRSHCLQRHSSWTPPGQAVATGCYGTAANKKTGNGTAYWGLRTSSYIIVHHRTSSYIQMRSHRRWSDVSNVKFYHVPKGSGSSRARCFLSFAFWIVCCQLSSFNSVVYFPGLAKTAFHFW